MNESIKHLTDQIKQARLAKGMSQLTLAKKSKIPQSHISKIENGAVNIQISSLLELSRVLELELMLVPIKASSAAKSLVKSIEPKIKFDSKYLNLLQKINTLSLVKINDGRFSELKKITEALKKPNDFSVLLKGNPEFNDTLTKLNKSLKNLDAIDNIKSLNEINKYSTKLQKINKMLEHNQIETLKIPRPKYRLDEED